MTEYFPQGKQGNGLRGILITAVLICGVIVGVLILFNTSRLQPNEEGHLDSAGNMTFVAMSSRAFDAMMLAAQQPGIDKLDQLRQSGDIVLVPRGTRVRVLGVSADRTRIEILDGAYADMTGYVPSRYVRR